MDPTDAAVLEVVGAVIVRGGRVLLTQRDRNRSQGGLWEFPGGKPEPGEALTEALRRELLEELGVLARVCEPIMSLEHAYPARRILLHLFRCELDQQTPRCLDVADLAWVWPDALLEYALAPADVPVALELQSRASAGSLRSEPAAVIAAGVLPGELERQRDPGDVSGETA